MSPWDRVIGALPGYRGYFKDLAAAGPMGVALDCLPWFAVLCWTLLPYAWRKQGRVVPRPWLVMAASLCVGWLGAGAMISWARLRYVQSALGLEVHDPSVKPRWIVAYVAFDLGTQMVVGASAVIAVPVLGAILATRLRRRLREQERSSTVPVFLVASVSAVTWAAALSLCRNVVDKQWDGCGMSLRDRYDMMMEGFQALLQGKWFVIGWAIATTLAVIAIGLAPRPHRWKFAGPRLSAGALVLSLGLAAWLSTRASLADARNPLPCQDERELLGDLDVELPPAHRCTLGMDAPMITWKEDSAQINGIPTRTASEVEGVLRAKRSLWQTLHPGKEFPGWILLGAPGSITLERLAPSLNAASNAGFVRGQALVGHAQETTPTRTMGEVRRSRRTCVVQFDLRAVAPSDATWGEFVSRIGVAP